MTRFEKIFNVKKVKFSISVCNIYGNVLKDFADDNSIPFSNVIDAILAEKFMDMKRLSTDFLSDEQKTILNKLEPVSDKTFGIAKYFHGKEQDNEEMLELIYTKIYNKEVTHDASN